MGKFYFADERFDDVAFMLDKLVVNFTRAVLDDAVEVNVDFQAKAGLDVFLLTDCLINTQQQDISRYPHGGFDELMAYIHRQMA